MKKTDKRQPIDTLPKGIWESSNPVRDKKEQKTSTTASTDLQGNGYPVNKINNHDKNAHK